MNLASYKAFFFDLDGCLRYGVQAAPGASELLMILRQQGKSLLVLTNTSSKGAADLAEELQRIGLQVAPSEIQTVFDAAGEYLRYRLGATKVLCVGTPALLERLRHEGHDVLPLERCREAAAVIVGRDPEFNVDRIVAAAKALDAGAVFIALNRDVRMPVEDGDYTAGAGVLVAAISALAYKEPEILGKPSRAFFELGLRRLGVAAHETVMIGDSIEADIDGGKASGLLSILITNSNVKSDADRSHADLVIRNVRELLDYFERPMGAG
jgi:HAD superfamily hydrolase (TIGR01450 family)